MCPGKNQRFKSHLKHVTCEAPLKDGQQGGVGGGRFDLIARNARGREIGVDLTITNHLNDGLRNYRRTESYGGMANTEAESRKNRLPYAAECKKRGIIYFGASMATDGTFGPCIWTRPQAVSHLDHKEP
jgi:hypothetical protein